MTIGIMVFGIYGGSQSVYRAENSLGTHAAPIGLHPEYFRKSYLTGKAGSVLASLFGIVKGCV